MNTIDLEKMPAMVNTTFRIPVNPGQDGSYRGTYEAMVIPAALPNYYNGYIIYITKQGENDEASIVWSETIKMVDGGFVLSDTELHKQPISETRPVTVSRYYHSSRDTLALRLNVAVFRAAPEKIDIKLTGPFSETY